MTNPSDIENQKESVAVAMDRERETSSQLQLHRDASVRSLGSDGEKAHGELPAGTECKHNDISVSDQDSFPFILDDCSDAGSYDDCSDEEETILAQPLEDDDDERSKTKKKLSNKQVYELSLFAMRLGVFADAVNGTILDPNFVFVRQS